MTRRELLQRFAALGLAAPFAGLPACAPGEGLYWDFDVTFTGRVVVVGAGAAGLAAGYLLDRYGIDFEIVEAAPVIGGRVRALEGFVSVDLDVGAEWIHQDPSVLAELVDDPDAEGVIDVIPYSPETLALARDGRLTTVNAGSNFYSEYKFRRTTWAGFLRDHIAAGILDRVHTARPITRIDHAGDRVVLTDADGGTLEADAVLVTVPLKILQERLITFAPALPEDKLAAIDAVFVPPGLKVFLAFSERFYPDATLIRGLSSGETNGDPEKVYYDAMFRKGLDANVLALFYVGRTAEEFTALGSDEAIVEAVLAELDQLFDGRASPALLQAVVQNWSAEPWIRGAYSYTFDGDTRDILDALNAPVGGRLFFAGEALSRDNGATVPGAMESAYGAVRALLEG
ncbi:MAG: FAD-dependent oxidoreductase [Alphaproteobacteria bacterium]|nr:FAD-dependent oxidoreductase [Alphaproteobacteria bacterium]